MNDTLELFRCRRSRAGSSSAGALILAALWLLSALMCAGLPTVSGSSEAREAQVISVILREGEWILPTRNGLTPSKPPLYHWGAAALATLTGVQEVSPWLARIPSVAAASLVLLLTMRLARRFCKTDDADRCELLAGALLLLTYGFSKMALEAMVDMTFAACVMAALYPVVRRVTEDPVPAGLAGTAIRPVDMLLFFGGCGLAVLAKGPLGFVLPSISIFAMLWGRWGVRRAVKICFRPSLGWVLFVGIALPWYWMASQVGADAFVSRQLIFENVQRFFGGEHMNSEPAWFYLPSLLRTAFPWSGLALAVMLGRYRRARRDTVHPSSLERQDLLLLWLGAGVLLFSCSSGKRHSYLLPLFPALAIYLAVELQLHLRRTSEAVRARSTALRDWALNHAISLAAVVALLGPVAWLLPEPSRPERRLLRQFFLDLSPLLASAAGVAALLMFLARSFSRESVQLRAPLAWWAWSAALLTLLSIGDAAKGYIKGYDRIGAQIRAQVGADTVFAVRSEFDESLDPVLYYLHRRIAIVAPGAVREAVGAGKCWILGRRVDLPPSLALPVAASRAFAPGEKYDPEHEIVLLRINSGAS